MTIPANSQAEAAPWGSIPVTPCFGPQGGPYETGVNNQDVTLLASAARTVLTSSADQTSYNSRGVVVFLNVTAASGTGGLSVRLQAKDPVSGQYVNVNTAPTAVTATGTFTYVLYPGASAGGYTQTTPQILPRTWRVQVTVGDASSYTYSVGASVIL